MISPPARSVLNELNDIIRLDGGELHFDASDPSRLEVQLDLTNSSCPECVLPKELLLELLTTRLAEVDPDISDVRLHDPREDGEAARSSH